ncbi:hypothetical protein GCM10010172_34240 [Paractinoplanes ferrugineus]|uniref:Uncharacterized protein n=2 Tax=Paractinoplanes ferrugineus TaxID=113564 RepID=A0A919J693_9ACTN|nr:hypothetical protein Afe05nite_64850 [Actinoplanes ferrugineus]
MARRTRSTVAGATIAGRLSTLATVDTETPAALATSRMPTAITLPPDGIDFHESRLARRRCLSGRPAWTRLRRVDAASRPTPHQFVPPAQPADSRVRHLRPMSTEQDTPPTTTFSTSPAPDQAWAPPTEGWAAVPTTAAVPTSAFPAVAVPGAAVPGAAVPGAPVPGDGAGVSGAGRWTGKKVAAAVALTAALAGGAGFGIGMAVDSGGSSTQQGQFPGGGAGNGGPGGGMLGGGGFGS